MTRLITKPLNGAIGITTPERADEFDIAWFDRAALEAQGARRVQVEDAGTSWGGEKHCN